MGRVPYKCDPDAYVQHYCQKGGGSPPYFKGHLTQRGYGNILGSLIRSGIPLVKKVMKSPLAKRIGKEALRTGTRVLDDYLLQKKPLKESLKKRTGELFSGKKVAEITRKERPHSARKYRRVDQDILDF